MSHFTACYFLFRSKNETNNLPITATTSLMHPIRSFDTYITDDMAPAGLSGVCIVQYKMQWSAKLNQSWNDCDFSPYYFYHVVSSWPA